MNFIFGFTQDRDGFNLDTSIYKYVSQSHPDLAQFVLEVLLVQNLCNFSLMKVPVNKIGLGFKKTGFRIPKGTIRTPGINNGAS